MGDQGWFQMYPPPRPRHPRPTCWPAPADAEFHTLDPHRRRPRRLPARAADPRRPRPAPAPDAAPRAPGRALPGLGDRHPDATGMPRMRLLDSYADQSKTGPSCPPPPISVTSCRAAPDWDYVAALREAWAGPFILKGVLGDRKWRQRAKAEGVDAVWVSNHAGRQFDGAPVEPRRPARDPRRHRPAAHLRQRHRGRPRPAADLRQRALDAKGPGSTWHRTCADRAGDLGADFVDAPDGTAGRRRRVGTMPGSVATSFREPANTGCRVRRICTIDQDDPRRLAVKEARPGAWCRRISMGQIGIYRGSRSKKCVSRVPHRPQSREM
jgi:hypothetical protein